MNRIILILLVLIVSFQGFSQNLTAEDKARIERDSYAIRTGSSYQNLELLPQDIDIEAEFLADINEYAPEICVEMLYEIDKPVGLSNDELVVYLLNNLRAFSKQVGIEYFSRRKQAMSLLIEESYFTTPDGRDVLPDPVASEIIPTEESFYYQNDTTFGGNNYKLITKTTENTIWLQMENLEKLTVYKFFKALDEGKQRTNFIVTIKDDKILIYALAQIQEEPKIKKILTYDVNIPYSFERRMNSIITWFKESI